MKMKDLSKNKASAKKTNTTPIAMVVMVLCLAGIIGTIELSKLSGFNFIADHRNTFVSIELTIFVITLVELIGRAIVANFRRRGIEPWAKVSAQSSVALSISYSPLASY